MKIIVVRPMDTFNFSELNKIADLDVEYVSGIDEFKKLDLSSEEEKILAIDPDFTDWSFPNELIGMVNNLKAICLSTTAYSYIDLDYLKDNNILLTNIPKYAGESVAEYMLFQALCLAKKYPLQLKSGKQEFTEEYEQIMLKGRKAGIIGLGNNGFNVAKLCQGLGMDVCYWNRSDKDSEFKYLPLEEIFSSCDVIFETLAVNDETKKLITDDMINSMKPTTIFISGTARELYNNELVLEKVKNHELYGVAWEEEGKSINDFEGNVFVTSEYAWFTGEASANRIDIWLSCILAAACDKPINIVY